MKQGREEMVERVKCKINSPHAIIYILITPWKGRKYRLRLKTISQSVLNFLHIDRNV